MRGRSTFGADIAKFAGLIEKDVDTVWRGVIIKLFSAVVHNTPVDTGALRGSWRVSFDAPSQDKAVRMDISGGAVRSEIEHKVNAATAREHIFFTNNLPYASRIEYDGWSHTQAPDGMVRINVMRYQRLIKEEIKKLT